MLYPTIDELTKGKYNRYELSLATAKCARLVTDEYVKQREEAEKSITGNKETDKPINTMIDKELRDEKAVKTAIRRIYDGEYVITLDDRQDDDDIFADGENASEESDEEKNVQVDSISSEADEEKTDEPEKED